MGKKSKSLRHGSLFSGIGGFELAAEWMGWENVFHCEFNPFCQRVLQYYYPKAESYGDIRTTDFTKFRGKIDLITGGFPCQPYSVAGKRLGKEDERHLWPDMLRAIREIRPQWVVGENVLGIISWNGGVVFEEVQADLEAQGYEVQPFVLPAAGVNAPHRRDRVWFIAYRDGAGLQKTGTEQQTAGTQQPGKLDEVFADPGNIGCDNGSNHREGRPIQTDEGIAPEDQPEREGRGYGTGKAGATATHSECGYAQNKRHEPGDLGKEDSGRQAARPEHAALQDHWENWPTESPVCNGNDGLSGQLDGITFPKWRIESIKAGGNAIVPQVAYQIFRAIAMTMRNIQKMNR